MFLFFLSLLKSQALITQAIYDGKIKIKDQIKQFGLILYLFLKNINIESIRKLSSFSKEQRHFYFHSLSISSLSDFYDSQKYSSYDEGPLLSSFCHVLMAGACTIWLSYAIVTVRTRETSAFIQPLHLLTDLLHWDEHFEYSKKNTLWWSLFAAICNFYQHYKGPLQFDHNMITAAQNYVHLFRFFVATCISSAQD